MKKQITKQRLENTGTTLYVGDNWLVPSNSNPGGPEPIRKP